MTDRRTSDLTFQYVPYRNLEKLERTLPEDPSATFAHSFDILKSCPHIKDDFPFFFSLNDGSIPACSCWTYPDTLFSEAGSIDWAWAVALETHPAYRGRGLATKLLREMLSVLKERNIGWGALFGTEASIRVFEKIGSRFAGYVPRFVMLKSLRPFFLAHLRSAKISGFLDLITRPWLRFYFNRMRRKSSTGTAPVTSLTIEGEENAASSLSRFPAVRHVNRNHFLDSPAVLGWKLRISNSRPGNTTTLHEVRHRSTDDPLGYYVIRRARQTHPIGGLYRDFQAMTLMDFGLFKDDPGLLPALLDDVLSLFWSGDCEALQVMSSLKPFRELLKARGFLRLGRGMSFNLAFPDSRPDDPRVRGLDNWSLTHFSADTFCF